ncbi:MAG: ribonuclease P protein component [Candidatus Eisenbacteria bacterium]
MKKPNQSLSRGERLRLRKEFERVYDEGTVVQTRHIVLFCLTRNVEGRKAGFVTGKKLGRATTRNRIRRRLREAYRRLKSGFPDDVHLIFIGRRGIAELEWKSLFEEMEMLVAKAAGCTEGRC